MKFFTAFLFFAGVCAQNFLHIEQYSTANCSGSSTDLGYFVSGQCWGFDGLVYTELNNTDAGYVRYEHNCMTGCTGCAINQNIALGDCTDDMRTLSQTNPTLDIAGGMAFELYADAGCATLQSVVIRPPGACYALTGSTSFFLLCNPPDYIIEYYTCDDVDCGGTCNPTGSYPTSPSGTCYTASNTTYNIPTYFVGYCNVYPPVMPTTTTTTSTASATTTTAATATTTSSSGEDNSTSTTTTSSTAAATSTSASATTTTSTTSAAATSTTTASATSTTTSATSAAATTTTGTTTTATATTTTGAAATTTTTTTTTGAAATTTTTTATPTTMVMTTSGAHSWTFGVLISAVCIAISFLI